MFSRLDVTFATLFWSLFGISSPKSTDLEEEHGFIETVGQGLFMAYHVMSIIVLINMLIAMMSNSFQQIEVSINNSVSDIILSILCLCCICNFLLPPAQHSLVTQFTSRASLFVVRKPTYLQHKVMIVCKVLVVDDAVDLVSVLYDA